VLIDASFLGGVAWKTAGGDDRPPLVVVDVTLLTIAGAGCRRPASAWPPHGGVVGRARDAAVSAVTQHVLVRPGLAQLHRVCATTIGRRLPGLLFDGPLLADLLLVRKPVLRAVSGGFEPPAADRTVLQGAGRGDAG
jgi:hypothetical protein